MVQINPSQWHEKLQQAIGSQKEAKGNGVGRQYIVLEGEEIKLSPRKSKLSIKQITELSKILIGKLKNPSTDAKAKEFKQLATDIHQLTNQLIDLHDAKRNRPLYRFLRTVAQVISVVFFLPLFFLFRQNDLKFRLSIYDLRKVLSNSKEEALAAIDTKMEAVKIAAAKQEADAKLLSDHNFSQEEIAQILALKEAVAPLMDRFHLLSAKESKSISEKIEFETVLPEKLRLMKLLLENDFQQKSAEQLISMKGDIRILLLRLKNLSEKSSLMTTEKLEIIRDLKVKFQLQRIPEIVNQVKEKSDDMRQAELQEHFNEETSSPPSSGNLNAFEGDFARTEAFYRKDAELNIDDKTPQPPYLKSRDKKDLSAEELKKLSEEEVAEKKKRVNTAAGLLDELLKFEEGDTTWKYILQTAPTQFSILRFHGEFMNRFNIDKMMNQTMWDDPIDHSIYSLKTEFTGGDHPPIGLEVIRDPSTKKIAQVNVEVIGSIDILSFSAGAGPNNEKIVLPEAFSGSLKYSITLDNEKHPVISNVVSKIEAKGPLPKT